MRQKRRKPETQEQQAERWARESLRKQENDQRARNQAIAVAMLTVRSCRMNRTMIHQRVAESLRAAE